MKTCRFLWVVGGLIAWGFFSNVQAQEKYPNRPIELVSPFGPGGTADIAARLYSDDLARNLKVRIVVVNRPGGGSSKGALFVARAKKDGYTLLAGGGGTMIMLPIIDAQAAYDTLRDFSPLGHFGTVPSVYVVRSDSPIKSFGELIDYARKNPGKVKNAGSGPGTGAFTNLAVLEAKANVKFNTIPFDSSGETVTALLGGHVDMTSSGFVTMGPLIKAGKFRPLAIVAKTRHPDFPDIPTTAEVGYPYMSYTVWMGIFGPAGLPKPVLNILASAVEKTFKNPAVIARAAKVAFMADYKGPEEFRKFIESETRVWSKVYKDVGLSVR